MLYEELLNANNVDAIDLAESIVLEMPEFDDFREDEFRKDLEQALLDSNFNINWNCQTDYSFDFRFRKLKVMEEEIEENYACVAVKDVESNDRFNVKVFDDGACDATFELQDNELLADKDTLDLMYALKELAFSYMKARQANYNSCYLINKFTKEANIRFNTDGTISE